MSTKVLSVFSPIEGTTSPSTFGGVTLTERNAQRLLAKEVAATATTDNATTTVYLNSASNSDDCAVSALKVSRALEELNVPFVGVRSRFLEHDAENIKMLAFYADIAVPSFAVLTKTSPSENFSTIPVGLNYPVRLRLVTNPNGDLNDTAINTSPISDDATYAKSLADALDLCPKVMVEEDISRLADVEVFFYTASVDPASALKKRTVKTLFSTASKKHEDAVLKRAEEIASAILLTFVDGVGFGTATLKVKPASETEQEATLLLQDVEFNCRLGTTGASGLAASILAANVDSTQNFLDTSAAVALQLHAINQRSYTVGFDIKDKGYYVRASRDLKKGAMVFEDEGTEQVITTRPFVMSNWTEEDKVVFSRFAWPLDEESHVYVTWHDSPKKWRPINHSCDPNLIYGEKNSLNVYAARDIAQGEDLTLDYATFCDFSMKPFKCFCGSTQCRGEILPNQEALAKYGTNAWHRKMPSTAAGTVSTKGQ